MTIREIFKNGIQPLLIEKAEIAPTFIRERVIGDINAALQFMSTGVDYFTREPISFSIDAGAPSIALPEDTLNIFGPCMLGDGSPLTRIETRGEFEQFAQIYLGYTTAAPSGKPHGYYVEKSKRQGSDNTVALTARFTPLPSVAYTVALEISRRPPTYTVAQIEEPSPTVPLPHKFAESILLPIVRWNVRTSHLFGGHEMLASMEQEYNTALAQLGMSQPTQGAQTTDALERKKAAARAAAREAYANTP